MLRRIVDRRGGGIPKGGGFALVVALCIMSFILLLLLSLSTFVQIEIKREEGQTAMAMAKQNAILGMHIALSQLQQYAGPDQRATAPASILGGPGGADVKHPHWIGVWDTSDRDPGSAKKPAALTWLVSGNEDGEQEPAYSPLNNLPSSTKTVWLLRNAVLDNPDLRVQVPLVPLRKESEGAVAGHYGYWVADESLKARINVIEPEAAVAQNDRTRLMSSPRAAIEKIPIFEAFDYTDDRHRELARRIHMPDELSLVLSESTEKIGSHFHDITTYSYGLPVDALNGGLKQDLSRGLEDDPLSGSLYPRPSGFNKDIPTWETLISYYRLADRISSAGQVQPSASTNTFHGVHPIVLLANIMDGLYLRPVAGNPGKYEVCAALWSGWTMHNPNNVELEPTDYVFEISHFWFGVRFTIEPGSAPSSPRPVLGDSFSSNQVEKDFSDILSALPSSGVDMTPEHKRHFIRVKTSAPVGFAPGEIRAFSTQPETQSDGPLIYQAHYSGDSFPQEYQLVHEGVLDAGYILVPTGIILSVEDLYFPNTDSGVVDFSNPANPPVPRRIFMHTSGYPAIKVYAVVNGSEQLVADISGSYNSRVGSGANLQTYRIWAEAEPETILPIYGGVIRPLNPRSYYGGGGGGVRLLADFNIRAMAPEISSPPTGSPQVIIGNVYGQRPYQYISGTIWGRVGTNPALPVNQTDRPVFWDINTGRGFSGPGNDYNGYSFLTLFDVPRSRPHSLGALRHANIYPGWYGLNNWGQRDAWAPSYIIGNSRPHFSVGLVESESEAEVTYQVNRALWDSYFFSSIPVGFDKWNEPLPNPRMVLWDFDPEDNDAVKRLQSRESAAAFVVVEGPFNVNSTSVTAWKTLLGSLSEMLSDPDGEFDHIKNPFPSSLWTPNEIGDGIYKDAGSHLRTDGIPNGSEGRRVLARGWNGFPSLSDAELSALAEKIVEQVQIRGPFLSLADFINRTLIDKDSRAPVPYESGFQGVQIRRDTRYAGTLQAAIDSVTEADVFGSGNDNRPWLHEPIRRMDADENVGLGDVDVQNFTFRLPKTGVVNTNNLGNNTRSSAAANAFPSNLNIPVNPGDNAMELALGYFSTDAPGYLSQMNLLVPLAPILTVRGDTFIIRAYGDTVNPLTGEAVSRAWCEAVVQRLPEYMDPSQLPEASPSQLNGINAEWGRRFRIVSFRWLNEKEI